MLWFIKMADDMFKEEPEEEFEEDPEEDINLSESYDQEEIDEYNRQYPVLIGKDCRDPEERGLAGDLTGYQGILLGLYNYSKNFKRLDELKKLTNVYEVNEVEDANPLIYIPKAMEYIWGIECWWSNIEGISNNLQSALNTIEDLLSKGKTPEDINWDEFLKQQ